MSFEYSVLLSDRRRIAHKDLQYASNDELMAWAVDVHSTLIRLQEQQLWRTGDAEWRLRMSRSCHSHQRSLIEILTELAGRSADDNRRVIAWIVRTWNTPREPIPPPSPQRVGEGHGGGGGS